MATYQVVGSGGVVEEAVVVPGQRCVTVECAQSAAALRLLDARPSTDDVGRRRRRHGDTVAFPHEPRTAIHVSRVHVLQHHAPDIRRPGSDRWTLIGHRFDFGLLLSAPTIYTGDFNFRLKFIL